MRTCTFVVLAALSSALCGCAWTGAKTAATSSARTPLESNYVMLLDNGDGTVGEIDVDGRRARTTLSQVQSVTWLDGTYLDKAAIDDDKLRSDFGAAIAASPRRPVTIRLYFASRSMAIDEASRKEWPRVLQEIARRPGADVSVVGHTDTTGDAQRNVALGLTRARRVADMLMRSHQIDAEHVAVESRGERFPLVKTEDMVDEPRNRRVEITVR